MAHARVYCWINAIARHQTFRLRAFHIGQKNLSWVRFTFNRNCNFLFVSSSIQFSTWILVLAIVMFIFFLINSNSAGDDFVSSIRVLIEFVSWSSIKVSFSIVSYIISICVFLLKLFVFFENYRTRPD